MGANSKIEWTDHTFNPWTGCTKVSAACDHCYAESWAKRIGKPELWQGERNRTSVNYWKQPFKWDKSAATRGGHERVFCASLADVFDNQVPEEWRADLFRVIANTPSLDWLLLTKRPQNVAKMLPADWAAGWPNVWLGNTTENQNEYDRRWPHLARVPASVHFISYEPALGPLTLSEPYPEWVICGGESGGKARPMEAIWAQRLRDQCAALFIPFHFKQWGAFIEDGQFRADGSRVVTHFDSGWMRGDKHENGRLLDGIEHNGFPLPRKLSGVGR